MNLASGVLSFLGQNSENLKLTCKWSLLPRGALEETLDIDDGNLVNARSILLGLFPSRVLVGITMPCVKKASREISNNLPENEFSLGQKWLIQSTAGALKSPIIRQSPLSAFMSVIRRRTASSVSVVLDGGR